MDTVTIGCKLPHGMMLEVGYEITQKDDIGREFTSLRKLPDYAAVRLNGSHNADGTAAAARMGLALPAKLTPGIGLTKVARDFWGRWKSAHKDMFDRLNKTGVLFEAKDDAEAAAKVIDRAKVESKFEPLNPEKLPVHTIGKLTEE